MNEAIITAVATLLVCLVNNFFQQRELERKQEEQVNLIAYKLEQLEIKVNKHNNLVERMYGAEAELELLEEKVKVANHRIEDLEGFHK